MKRQPTDMNIFYRIFPCAPLWTEKTACKIIIYTLCICSSAFSKLGAMEIKQYLVIVVVQSNQSKNYHNFQF